jgi:hypothetical protein
MESNARGKNERITHEEDTNIRPIAPPPNTGMVRPESHRRLTGASPVMVATRRPCSRRPVHLGNRVC